MSTSAGSTGLPDREALALAVHDLRAPLTVIRGLCEVLARREPSAATRRGLTAIDGEVGRIARGLDELALVAPPAQDDIDVGVLAAAAVQRFRWAAAERDARVLLRGCAGACVRGDGIRLMRLLDNLLGNAVRHCARGGLVRVTVRIHGDAVRVRVRDDGPGVPAADAERIFVPGDRGSAPRGPGQGLGLAIARRIAGEHGGTLALAPTGPGATFVLSLPRAAGAGPSCPAA